MPKIVLFWTALAFLGISLVNGNVDFHREFVDDPFHQEFETPSRHSVWKSPKMSHLNFWILAFSTNFCPNKIDLSDNTQNVNVSRFARYVEYDFLKGFPTLCCANIATGNTELYYPISGLLRRSSSIQRISNIEKSLRLRLKVLWKSKQRSLCMKAQPRKSTSSRLFFFLLLYVAQ